MVRKPKMLKVYYNLPYLKFQFWCQKLFLLNIYHLLGPNWCQNLLKFGTFDIWNIPISLLMSKIIFIKYVLPAGLNWSQNQKCSEFIEIWPNWYFKYVGFDFDVKYNFYEILASCLAKICPKIKIKNVQNLLKFGFRSPIAM